MSRNMAPNHSYIACLLRVLKHCQPGADLDQPRSTSHLTTDMTCHTKQCSERSKLYLT